jgi:hypothetical protein
MSNAASVRPDLWFLTPPAPDRWQAFVAYFASRGYGCYTWPMPDSPATTRSFPAGQGPAASGMVVIAWRMLPRALLLHLAPIGWALLAPSVRSLLRLGHQTPFGLGWVGLGSRQDLATRLAARRLRSRPSLTVHTFDGLGADLPFAPGWERVAYALRRWLEGG